MTATPADVPLPEPWLPAEIGGRQALYTADQMRAMYAAGLDAAAAEAQRILSGKHEWSFVSDGKTYATEQEFIAAAVAAAIRALKP